MAEAGKLQAPPALPVYYMKLLTPNSDARLGKLAEGQIIAMDQAKATRYLTAGVAEQVSQGEFEQQQDRRQTKATAAQNAYRALNDGHAVWDVSTYRDVLTAPESGLRIAHERGIPLINVHMLRDEDGDVLPPDADIDDILDARANLHPDLAAPFAAHDRSSVMGGGSPYISNMPGATPMPLSPQHRAQMERVQQQEVMAQQPAAFSYDRENPNAPSSRPPQTGVGSNEERVSRAAHRAGRPQVPPKDTPVSPEAAPAAESAGVPPASGTLKPEQRP